MSERNIQKNYYIWDAIQYVGATNLAEKVEVHRTLVYRWPIRGFPRTEWTIQTSYAKMIEKLSGGKFLANRLLEESLAQNLIWLAEQRKVKNN